MKTLIAVAVVSVMSMTTGAHAGGFFNKQTSVLSNITGIVANITTRDVNILTGTTVAVGNNSNILSGIAVGNGSANNLLKGGSVLNGLLGGNGILGIGGQNLNRW